MSIEWNKQNCISTLSNSLFGLCDDEDENNKTPAYVSTDPNDFWIASILNPQTKLVTFTAVDNCIPIFRIDGNMESRCDGIISYDDTIIFVELKNKTKKWISGSLDQIDVTLKLFNTDGLLSKYNKRIAYIANRKKQQVPFGNLARQEYFDKEWQVVVHSKNTIEIN